MSLIAPVGACGTAIRYRIPGRAVIVFGGAWAQLWQAAAVMDDPWNTMSLDLHGYLERVGVEASRPSLPALTALHRAHVETFTFDNVDVLLEQHPGVGLGAIQEKFIGRGRGGYCFEHATLLAAVLERLGYAVTRRLGRVTEARTHMTVSVELDGGHWLCDPGFGMSLLGPIELADGATAGHGGWQSRMERLAHLPGWSLQRLRDGGWEQLHTIDELPVEPVDPVVGHHFTSTFPDSHFRHQLMLSRYIGSEHVTVTRTHLTIRRPGKPTARRELAPGELRTWLQRLAPSLVSSEISRLT